MFYIQGASAITYSHSYHLIGCFLVNRGPNKRQIKPAENNSLLQLALGEDSDDSEEDEDFEIDDDDDDEGFVKNLIHFSSLLLNGH